MAKFTRFDPRNKKRNKHKQKSKDGLNTKRIRYVGKEYEYSEEKDVYTQRDQSRLR